MYDFCVADDKIFFNQVLVKSSNLLTIRNSEQRGVASVNIVTTGFNPLMNYEIVY